MDNSLSEKFKQSKIIKSTLRIKFIKKKKIKYLKLLEKKENKNLIFLNLKNDNLYFLLQIDPKKKSFTQIEINRIIKDEIKFND